MVDDLFKTPGAGQEGDINAFAADVDSDQRMEIDRMRAMLGPPADRRRRGTVRQVEERLDEIEVDVTHVLAPARARAVDAGRVAAVAAVAVAAWRPCPPSSWRRRGRSRPTHGEHHRPARRA